MELFLAIKILPVIKISICSFFSLSLRRTLMVRAASRGCWARRWRATRPLPPRRPRPHTRQRWWRSAPPRDRRRWRPCVGKTSSKRLTASSRRPSPEHESGARRTSHGSWVPRVFPARPSYASTGLGPPKPGLRRRGANVPASSPPPNPNRRARLGKSRGRVLKNCTQVLLLWSVYTIISCL